MQLTGSQTRPLLSSNKAKSLVAAPNKDNTIIRARIAQATMLSAAAFAIGLGLFIAYGGLGLALFAPALPVAMCLLWGSADVTRADENDERRASSSHN